MPVIKFNQQHTIKYETDAVSRQVIKLQQAKHPHLAVHNVNDQDKTKMIYFRGTCVLECNTKSRHLRVVYLSESLLLLLNDLLNALEADKRLKYTKLGEQEQWYISSIPSLTAS